MLSPGRPASPSGPARLDALHGAPLLGDAQIAVEPRSHDCPSGTMSSSMSMTSPSVEFGAAASGTSSARLRRFWGQREDRRMHLDAGRYPEDGDRSRPMALYMSLAVPSPPAKSSRSTPSFFISLAALCVSSGVVSPLWIEPTTVGAKPASLSGVLSHLAGDRRERLSLSSVARSFLSASTALRGDSGDAPSCCALFDGVGAIGALEATLPPMPATGLTRMPSLLLSHGYLPRTSARPELHVRSGLVMGASCDDRELLRPDLFVL